MSRTHRFAFLLPSAIYFQTQMICTSVCQMLHLAVLFCSCFLLFIGMKHERCFFCQIFLVDVSRNKPGEYNHDFTAGFTRSKLQEIAGSIFDGI